MVVYVSYIYPPVFYKPTPIPLTTIVDTIPAGGIKVVNIQPPPNEVWKIYICAHSYVLYNGSYVEIVASGGYVMKREYGDSVKEPTVCVEAVVTNSNYVFVRANNPGSSSVGLEVVYSGEKL